MIARTFLAAAAASLVASSALAQAAQPVRPASATLSNGAVAGISARAAHVREGAEVEEGSDIFALGLPFLLIAAAVAVAVVAAVAVAGDDESSPS